MTDVRTQLIELAKIATTGAVVSVYLNTRWADEHQRERVRVFLKNEVRKARQAEPPRAADDDFQWVEEQAGALIQQTRLPDADGVALFACQALGLRVVLPVRVPFPDAFVVADRPFLRPLAALAETVPSALVVFVDGQSARLVPLQAAGAGEEVALESEVPGQHRRGGWAALAQSRYQRHILDHRARHFEAVAQSLVGLAETNGAEQIVMAGESRTVAAFRRHLPQRIATRIIGTVPASRHESADALLSRAIGVLSEWQEKSVGATVSAVLTEAAKSGQAVAGLDETLEAVARGAVRRLYLVPGFDEPGQACGECDSVTAGSSEQCRRCGGAVRAIDLGEAIVNRVVASGGTVEVVTEHPELARVGGVAASLRYPL